MSIEFDLFDREVVVYSKECAHCQRVMKKVGAGKIWLISCNKRNERVCNDCWEAFLEDDRVSNGGLGAKEMDDEFNEKMCHLDRFIEFANGEKKNASDDRESITCTKCRKVMCVEHVCYRNIIERQFHTLNGNDLCHWCWDKELEISVEIGGY